MPRTRTLLVASLLVTLIGCGAAPQSADDDGASENATADFSARAGLYKEYTDPSADFSEIDLRADGTFNVVLRESIKCRASGEPIEAGYVCDAESYRSVVHGTWVPAKDGATLTPRWQPQDGFVSDQKTGNALKLSMDVKGDDVTANLTFQDFPAPKTLSGTLRVLILYKKPASASVALLRGNWNVDGRRHGGTCEVQLLKYCVSGVRSHVATIGADGTYTETIVRDVEANMKDPESPTLTTNAHLTISGDPHGTTGVFFLEGKYSSDIVSIASASQDKFVLQKMDLNGPYEITFTRGE